MGDTEASDHSEKIAAGSVAAYNSTLPGSWLYDQTRSSSGADVEVKQIEKLGVEIKLADGIKGIKVEPVVDKKQCYLVNPDMHPPHDTC